MGQCNFTIHGSKNWVPTFASWYPKLEWNRYFKVIFRISLLDADPPEVVTTNIPLVVAFAVAGITKISFDAVVDFTVALMPATFTVAPFKLIPVTVTVPTPRFVTFDWVNEMIFGAAAFVGVGEGAGSTVNDFESVPPAVVTTTFVTPAATVGTLNVTDVFVGEPRMLADVVLTFTVAESKL